MSSFNRRLFLTGLTGTLALGACGFEPALAPGGSADALRGTLRPRDPKNRNEFLVVKRFEERLGTAPGAAMTLNYAITTSATGLAITQAQETTRFNLIGKLAYTVTDPAGNVLTEGNTDSFTSYSATGTTVASLSAERAANERLMVILTDQMITQLTATSRIWAK